MDIQMWIRIMGLVVAFAMSGDVAATVAGVSKDWIRKRLAIVIVMLPVLNFIMLLTLIFMKEICPAAIKILAGSYYSSKVLTGYLYCMRADLLLRGPMMSRKFRHIINALKGYLLIAFFLNVGKAFILYQSSLVADMYCVPDFGTGFWVSLDEVMFSIADFLTFSMMLYFYGKHLRGTSTASSSEAHLAFKRILRITAIPLCFTFAIIIQIKLDPDMAKYMGDLDMQVQMLCLFLAYSKGGKKNARSQQTTIRVNPTSQSKPSENTSVMS